MEKLLPDRGGTIMATTATAMVTAADIIGATEVRILEATTGADGGVGRNRL